ncbi:O-mannosyltransferase domain protein [Mycobacterium xenopi 3993]|nr:O-mannosyltransferase domain protein [Mycobacterium xenopi 3993]
MRRDWRYAAVLVGYCAGWLPWFADIDRQMYFFYAATMAPFLVMAIALILGTSCISPAEPGATNPRADRGVLLRRAGVDQLRVVVPGAYRSADLAVHLEHGDLVTQLAVSLSAKQKPRLRLRNESRPWLLSREVRGCQCRRR